jgi:hypothetical protein
MIGKCVRCKRDRWLKGRRLCDSCYTVAQRTGTIYTYPTVSQERMNRPLVCICTKPLVERLILWDAYECKQCGLRIAPARIEELGL